MRRRKSRGSGFWVISFILVIAGIFAYNNPQIFDNISTVIHSSSPCSAQINSELNKIVIKSVIRSHTNIIETKTFTNGQEAQKYIKEYLTFYADTEFGHVYGAHNLNTNGVNYYPVSVTLAKQVSDKTGSSFIMPLYAFVCVNGSL